MTTVESPNVLTQLLSDVIAKLGQFIRRSNQDLITVLRQPTPQKVTKVLTADGSGNIPLTDIYTCPVSHEGWVNRIAITSPGGSPKTPLTTGEVIGTGSTSGELIFFLPLAGTVAPIWITEGRMSASHLNDGERIQITADSLPANTSLRFDFQIILVTGVSPDTPGNDNIRYHNAEVID